jgi:hypothetical protein
VSTEIAATPHDFRRTISTWLDDHGERSDVVELILGHFPQGDKNDKDYQGAIDKLSAVVNLVDRSNWRVNASSKHKQEAKQRKVARLLTDAFGMIGGYLRRLDRSAEALEQFARGRTLERNAVFEIDSTYNSVNWIVTKLEIEPQRHAELGDDLEIAIKLLDRHTKGTRNRDGWAWADLGTCQVLSRRPGDLERAKYAFDRFVELSSRGDISSCVRVIETVQAALERTDPALCANTAAAIEYLKDT